MFNGYWFGLENPICFVAIGTVGNMNIFYMCFTVIGHYHYYRRNQKELLLN